MLLKGVAFKVDYSWPLGLCSSARSIYSVDSHANPGSDKPCEDWNDVCQAGGSVKALPVT